MALAIMLILSSKGFAQSVSSTIVANYPPGVVTEIFDLVVKTGLSEADQQIIADLIRARDHAVYSMIMDNKPYEDILARKLQGDDEIMAELGLEEKYDKFVKTKKENAKHKYTYSQFAIAIRYKTNIGLTQTQQDALMIKIEELKAMKNAHYNANGVSLDTRAYESEHISQILTTEQYSQMLLFKNRSKAMAFAETDWKEAEQRGITSTFTQAQAIDDLTNYYLARECTYNRYQHDLIRQKAEAKLVYENRPQILKALQKARRNPDNNTLNRGYRW